MLADSAALTISEVRKLSEESDNAEVTKAWDDWKAEESEIEKYVEGASEGRARLARLPMYKISPCVTQA